MALTTEQLREIAEKIDLPPNNITTQVMAQMARELLANREAQPVRYLNNFSGVCVTLEQQPNAADDMAVYSPLFTTPPARPVPRGIVIPEAATLTNINQLCPLDKDLSQTDFATGWNDCRQYALTHGGLLPVIKGVHAAAQGWNACRAVMLAAAENLNI